ncbi:CBN-DAF-4 protein [Caenorhabditis brenneri]|uniref:receptor protein serine/threonine kinase n=1 Tax=Caenorhabditis brenneri TaxID=135651 RepID=G0MPI1_CAEBE|nr:CBN-DAF-4 protein [Caenorhabditis brenneri]
MNSKGRLKLLSLLVLFSLLSALPVRPDEENEDDFLPDLRPDESEQVKDFVKGVLKDGTAADPVALKNHVEILYNDTLDTKDDDNEYGPPIDCAFYNHDDCLDKGKCNITVESCAPESHLKKAGCYAVFTYPPNNTENSTDLFLLVAQEQIQRLGCIQYQDHDLMGCAHHAICRQNNVKSRLGHCCCSEPHCNAKGLEQINPLMYNKGGFPLGVFLTVIMILILIFALCCLPICVYKATQKRKLEEENRKRINDEKTTLLENGNGHTPTVHPIVESIEMVETPKEEKKEIVEGVEEPKEEEKVVEEIVVPPKLHDFPISDCRMISMGRFGTVYRATWTDEDGSEKYVAVKKLPETQRKCYEAEKMIFDTLASYPKWYSCVVGFKAAQKVGNEYWIVTDFHERLCLYELLKHNTISIASCGRLLVSMLDGLQYLHDDRSFFEDYPKKPIIHRDIKTRNILVRRDMTACIADFGLARVYDNDHVKCDLLSQVGTKRYMSPEMLEGAVDLSPTGFKAMDVYSMALCMWEVISCTKIHENDESPEHNVPYFEVGFNPKVNVMREVLIQKRRPQWRKEVFENEQTKAFVKTTEEMWEHEASARITAGCALERIWSVILKQLPPPPPLSEGYHTESSEDSTTSIRSNQKPYNFMVDTRALKIYHMEEDAEHPTPDPYLSDCPPVPPIPDVVSNGVIQHAPGAEPSVQEEDEGCVDEKEKPTETVFNVEMGRYLTEGEVIAQALKKLQGSPQYTTRQDFQYDTRASSPTPSHTFF